MLEILTHPVITLLVILVMLFVFEFLELSWQKGETILDIMLCNYAHLLHFGILVFMALHINFLLIVGLVAIYGASAMWSLLIVKLVDLAYKFYILHQIRQRQLGKKPAILQALLTPVGKLRYIGCIVYPMAFFIGL